MRPWPLIGLLLCTTVCSTVDVYAATVSSQTFGRYEIVLQEGVSISMGEILGMVRRQSGLPEYPLLLRREKGALELSILGPGNRPLPLASTPWQSSRPAQTAGFMVAGSTRQDETLTLRLRQRSSPRQVRLTVNLRHLERMLEGER